MDYDFRFDIVWNNFSTLLEGLRITIMLSVLAMIFGTIIGLTIAIFRMRANRLVTLPAAVYVQVFRGTPALVQIVWIYYCLPIVLGLKMDAFTSLVVAMALNVGAYLSEVFRAGLQAIDKGHIDAASALGFRPAQVTRRIVVPQAAYRMIPAIGNEFISAIKLSSLCSVLGMGELMYQGQLIISNFFRPLEVFTVVALIYLVLTYSTSLVLAYLEWRLAWVRREKKTFFQHFREFRGSILRLRTE